ncbi:retrovirus-related pol polyprotein from transposon TNT 1-94, partial [Tanacetum coccineum]
CPVTILNTIDHLGKFDGKADEGFFVGYSINSKAFRVFNSRTRIVEENLHVQFIIAGNQSNSNASTKACDDVGDDEKKVTEEPGKEGGDSSKDGESNYNTLCFQVIDDIDKSTIYLLYCTCLL